MSVPIARTDEQEDPEARRWFDPDAAGLYVHVPFCSSICGYCDFYRIEAGRGVPAGFEDLLLAEAGQYGESPRLAVDTVFLGGGTPSLLEPPRLGRLLEGLGRVLEIARGAEVTLEANPETVSQRALEGWRAAGVTRLSVGVQSLDPGVLAALDRRATSDQALSAVRLAARAGFAHVSADVMSAVPGQSRESLKATLGALAASPIDHLSLYSLDLHPNTRLRESVTRGEKVLPDDEAAADNYLEARALLGAAGFEHYEVSNFARPGGRCRHNLRYWLGGETIGVGPSAWSRFRGSLYGNPRSLDLWRKAVEQGLPAHTESEELSESRRLEDRLIFGLRVAEGVPLHVVESVSARPDEALADRLRPLVEHGYAVAEGGRLRLTALGFLVSNEVIAYLLPEDWRRMRS